MIHADATLARRLEGIICDEWRRLAAIAGSLWPEKGATYLEVAGGVALWLGEGGLVNVATGLAMDGPIGDSEVRQVEDFYARRGAPPLLATCPFADPTLFAVLGSRGWRLTEFENVLALQLGSAASEESRDSVLEALDIPLPSGIEARPAATADERDLWGGLAARGFSDDDEPGPGQFEFGDIMAAHPGQTLVLGFVDGQPVGTGSVQIEGNVAWLSGDTTLPGFRGRGVQQALQRRRLQLARDAGCTLVVTESMAGSGSQRNMERLGFRVVYTHLQFGRV